MANDGATVPAFVDSDADLGATGLRWILKRAFVYVSAGMAIYNIVAENET